MVDLSILDWLFSQIAPLSAEETVLQIDGGLSDQVISEDIVVIINRDLEWRAAGERALKIKVLVESRIGFIQLVLVSLIDDLVVALDPEIRIRG